MIGYSYDIGGNFYGEMKNVKITNLALASGGILYGENSYNSPSHSAHLSVNGGADVYIRNTQADQGASGVRLTWLMAISTALLFLIFF